MRYYGYGGLILLLVALAVFIESVRESRYESVVAHFKGKVISKDIRTTNRINKIYGVSYRVTIESRPVEHESDVGSQELWDSFRIGDEVDIESVGVTPNETRMAVVPRMRSGVYRWAAAGLALAGIALIGVRLRSRPQAK